LSDALLILSAYLIGAIPFGLIITRLFGARDIRVVGSGNVGATNAVRAAGPVAGILVLLGDIGKGVAAVLLVSVFPDILMKVEYLQLAAGLAAVIGHIFPVYIGFKGGKGVNTALGVMLTLMTYQALIALVIFVVVVVLSRYVSLGSIIAAIAFFAAVLIGRFALAAATPDIYVLVSGLLMILIVVTHRANIKRLLNGNENRFSLSSGGDRSG
jgi:glycerol-3-phosphate acyltransferase PlsY